MHRSLTLFLLVLSGSTACAEILGFDETRELKPGGGGPAASYSAAVLADNPVAYFRFENAESPITDERSGTLVGSATGDLEYAVPAMIGNGLEFSPVLGDATTVVVDDVFDFPGSVPMSIECWARIDGAAEFQHLVSKRYNIGEDQYGWSLTIEPGSGVRYTRSNVGFRHVTAQPKLGQFSHIVATFDGDFSRIYVDGEFVLDKPGDLDLPDSTEPLRFGSGPTSSHFGGVLDELAIYNKVLSAERSSRRAAHAGVLRSRGRLAPRWAGWARRRPRLLRLRSQLAERLLGADGRAADDLPYADGRSPHGRSAVSYAFTAADQSPTCRRPFASS